MLSRSLGTLAALGLLLIASDLFAQAEVVPSVSAVRTEKKSYFGQLIERNEKELTMLDIMANDVITIPADEVQRVDSNYSHQSLQSMMGLPKYAAWRIASVANVGVIRGRVALVDASGYYVALGSAQGLEVGKELMLKGEGTVVTDPETGKEIGTIRPDLAKLKILDVYGEELSRVSLVDVSKPVDIKRGMVVEWRRTDKTLAVLPIDWEGKTETATGNEALVVQNELIDALIARGVTVVSKAQLELTTLKVSKELGVSAKEVPALALAEGVKADVAVTGAILPKTAKRADVRLRVLDTDSGNYLATVDGFISRDKAGAPKVAMDDMPEGDGDGDDGAVGDGPKILTNFIGMKFVAIPADEEIAPRGFEMGVFEVTQGEFTSVMRTNPSVVKGAAIPVNHVTWLDCVEFCRRLSEHPRSKADGYVYRLPRVEEWWYACRAGTETRFFFGDNSLKLGDYAWIIDNSGREKLDGELLGKIFEVDVDLWRQKVEDNGNSAKRCGLLKPNQWGLYDVLGNVAEWVSSDDADVVFSPGGGYLSKAPGLVANRNGFRRKIKDHYANPSIGFRVIREKIE